MNPPRRDEPQHPDEHQIVVLFERLLHYAEDRFGMTAATAVALLNAVQAREETIKTIIKGFWATSVTLVIAAAVTLLLAGLRVWVAQ